MPRTLARINNAASASAATASVTSPVASYSAARNNSTAPSLNAQEMDSDDENDGSLVSLDNAEVRLPND